MPPDMIQPGPPTLSELRAEGAPSLALRRITKRYGDTVAVRDVSLDVPRAGFLTLLGPSGSGKTTLLNVIAGFVAPTAGGVFLDGTEITRLPPERRGFGMVFQGYALFPHMSVADNVAFPLRVRRLGRAEREARVRAALDLVQLPGLEERRPAQLSGGQQQRVALARALVFDPPVLLLDEPLSALDRKLRAELQEELRALHRRIGRSFVNVTHDQEEALSLSDRVAVLNQGRLVQEGTPAELYERPRTRFVAGFLGAANFLAGRLEPAEGGRLALVAGGTRLLVAPSRDLPPGLLAGERATLALRPERAMVLRQGQAADNAVAGRILSAAFAGQGWALRVETADLGVLRVQMPSWNPPVRPEEGQEVRIGWRADAAQPVAADEGFPIRPDE